MKYLILTGGLGNQMFEYAFLLALREKGHDVLIDASYYDLVNMHNGYELKSVFGIEEPLIKKQGLHVQWLRWLNRFRPKCLYMVDGYSFKAEYLEQPCKYIWGYWQDERYFENIKDDVKQTFSFKNIDDLNKNLAHEIRQCNSVSMHIRRGDYAAFGMTIIGEDYYSKAIKYVKSKVENPLFYIFSDDESVAKVIADKSEIDYHLVTINRGEKSYQDMYLMSQCKHNIIANSSFSWWGAWLNSNPNKIVIAPSKWDARGPMFSPQASSWIKM